MAKPRGERAVLEFVLLRTTQICLPTAAGLAAARRLLPRRHADLLGKLTGVTVTVGLSAYFNAVFDHRTTWGYPLIRTLPPEAGNAIALTFDDGPHPDTTPALLDVLARHNARATFFLIAENVRRHPALARRIVDAGHTVACHGLRHRAMVLQTSAEVTRDLTEATTILEDATGGTLPRLLRPPHGFKTPTLCRTVTDLGWELVSWSLDSGDYDSPLPACLVTRLAAAKPRDIVLLHERADRTETTNAALPLALQSLRQSDVRFVSL